MLLVLFEAGKERYGLDSRRVVEVVSTPACRELPHAPAWVAGMANYRGRMIPVIDLTALICGEPSRRVMSTRMMVASLEPDRFLGLIAEHAVETLKCDPAALEGPTIRIAEAPYLGAVLRDDRGSVQAVTLDRLLPAEVRSLLYAEGVNA